MGLTKILSYIVFRFFVENAHNRQMKTIRLLFCICSLIGISHSGLCQEYQPSVDMRISYLPEAVHVDGKPIRYFEIYLTNFSQDSVLLDRLQVSTQSTRILWSAAGTHLKKQFSSIGASPQSDRAILPAGSTGIVYLELQAESSRMPLTYILRFTQVSKKGIRKDSITSEIVPFEKQKAPPVLDAPLKSGNWVAVYDPSWERGHRRVIYTINGKARIPGRYAIDFIRVDDQGKYAQQDENQIKHWYGYANEVLAVADGKVVGLRNDFPESPTISEHPAYTADKATGNYIALNIGGGYIVFYEHLKPGSLKVKLGQQVKRRETIAALGFTGQTTGPHLHFHVANANSPLGAEGVAFVFKQFKKIGSYQSLDNFGKQPWIPAKDHSQLMRHQERPGPNHVIQF